MPIRRLVFCCRSNTIDSERVNARGEMRLEDLPEELATEIRAIQRRYREELEASERARGVAAVALRVRDRAVALAVRNGDGGTDKSDR